MNNESVRDTTKQFLSAWLVERDPDKAAQFFGEDSFRNEAMLAAPCAGYIKPAERRLEAARRAGVIKFLRDFVPPAAKRGLPEVLSRAAIADDLAKKLAGKLINDPKADLFAVARLGTKDLPLEDSKESAYLRLHLPTAFYVSFVPLEEGLVYFVWLPEGNTWKIYHASLVCM
jgi:hypothetical protein